MKVNDKQKGNILEEYIKREALPSEYTGELNFYATVKSGDVNAVKEILEAAPFMEISSSELSENPLQSLKYHLVISAAMLARFCIEGGMEHKHAYEISDLYIKRGDKAKNHTELKEIHFDMCIDYAKQMNSKHKNQVFSKPVVMCIDYIYSHLHCRLTVLELADIVGLNKSYLSHLFKNEIGIPLSKYILIRKIEASQRLLRYSDYSSSEIAELLSFSSQSHFVNSFHKETGMTPREYRNRYFNNTGLSSR